MQTIPATLPEWRQLRIHSRLSNTDEDIAANIAHALTLGLPSLASLEGCYKGAVAVVGSGPSLKKTWKQLREFDGDIIACNAACQFLLGKGITPMWMFCFDADPLMLEFITPHPQIRFLIGSRCPPKTFELLEDCDVTCWHANGDRDIEKILQDAGKFDEPMVNGGSAAVTRCMMLAPFLGYDEVHLFGADSSYASGDTHIRKSTTDEKWMPLRVGARSFWCAPWMAQQAEDFKIVAPQLRDAQVRLVAHGDGLIPYLAHLQGFETDLETKVRHAVGNVRYKATELWRHL